jgi:hypothetical protein
MERAKDSLFITGVNGVPHVPAGDMVDCMTKRSAGQSVRRETLANQLFHDLRIAYQGLFWMSCQINAICSAHVSSGQMPSHAIW